MVPPDFFSRLRYESTALPCELQADLQTLRQLGQRNARRSRNWWLAAALIAGATLMAAVCGAPAGAAALFFFVGAAAVLGCVIAAFWTGASKLRERRLELAHQVVRHLACDMPPKTPATLNLDFNWYHKPCYATGTSSQGGVTVRDYELPWLSLSGRLADGNQFTVSVTTCVRRKERRKPKGTKVKETFQEGVGVQLKVRGQPGVTLDDWPSRLHDLPAPRGVVLSRTRAADGRLAAEGLTGATQRAYQGMDLGPTDIESKLADHHAVLTMFLASYTALRRCHRGGRSA